MTIKRIVIGGAVAAVAAVGIAVLSFVLLLGDAPEEVSLESAVAAASEASATAGTEAPTSATTTETTDSQDLAGVWTLSSDGTSFVGYRVQEELASIGATTAVGRTTVVTGTLEFDGSTIASVTIEADVSALESDEDRRDRALQQQALETASYPTATFVLTEPIVLASVPAEGETISATATGDLTVHGVTQTVSIPIEGQLVDGRVVVVGSTVIQFDDYDIEQPQAMAVLSVDDEATIELQLVFDQA